jgi:hypothetical protein
MTFDPKVNDPKHVKVVSAARAESASVIRPPTGASLSSLWNREDNGSPGPRACKKRAPAQGAPLLLPVWRVWCRVFWEKGVGPAHGPGPWHSPDGVQWHLFGAGVAGGSDQLPLRGPFSGHFPSPKVWRWLLTVYGVAIRYERMLTDKLVIKNVCIVEL